MASKWVEVPTTTDFRKRWRRTFTDTPCQCWNFSSTTTACVCVCLPTHATMHADPFVKGSENACQHDGDDIYVEPSLPLSHLLGCETGLAKLAGCVAQGGLVCVDMHTGCHFNTNPSKQVGNATCGTQCAKKQ